jgi:hypothetical protein
MSGYLTINAKLYFIRFVNKARKKTLFAQSNFSTILEIQNSGPEYEYLTPGQGS